jgi:hypothetical protein
MADAVHKTAITVPANTLSASPTDSNPLTLSVQYVGSISTSPQTDVQLYQYGPNEIIDLAGLSGTQTINGNNVVRLVKAGGNVATGFPVLFVQNCDNLLHLRLAGGAWGQLFISNNPSMTEYPDFSNLVADSVSGAITFSNCGAGFGETVDLTGQTQMSSFSFGGVGSAQLTLATSLPRLTNVQMNGTDLPANLAHAIHLTQLIFFSVNGVTGTFDATFAPSLATLLMYESGMTGINVTGLSLLSSVDLRGSPLDEANVDGVLVVLAGAAVSGGSVNLSGSCAPPSATGLAAKATLEARGWTVTVN